MRILLMDKRRRLYAAAVSTVCLSIVLGCSLARDSYAATAKEIDVSVDAALKRFQNDIKGGKQFIRSAKGVLVFPSAYKAGFVIGGEYGEGALRIGGKTVDYYSTVAGSWACKLELKKRL